MRDGVRLGVRDGVRLGVSDGTVGVMVGVRDGVSEGTVGVMVGVRDGVRVKVMVGVATGVTVMTQPLASVTVKPKELAGTIPGQFGSGFWKVKMSLSLSPASKSSKPPNPPGFVQFVGELESFVLSIVLPSNDHLSNDCDGFAASYAAHVNTKL